MFCLFLLCLLLQQASATSTQHEAKTNTKDEPIPERATDTYYNPIAFSAELSTNTYFGEGAILFDRIITNLGELYIPTSGQFLCPDEGLYVFVWSLWKGSDPGAPGMRATAKLRSAVTDLKYGPRSSYYTTDRTGVVEMTAVIQCTTSPLTPVTVMSMPWSEDEETLLDSIGTSFSGFRLSAPTAFTAELSTDQDLSPGSRIRFDRVLANFGGFYDSISHSFRCPDDGVYVFSVTTHNRDSTTPWSVSRLMWQGVVVMQGPITYIATDSYDSGSASTTAVLRCREGFQVYVEAQAAHDFRLNSYGAELTSFTGFKLYDDLPGAVAFTAVMTNNFTAETVNQPLMFDQVITNVGNAFNDDESVFVCPDDDTYLFTWTAAVNYGDSNLYTDLYMDNIRIKYVRLSGQSADDVTGTSGSGSVSIIRQCTTGSRLQVVARHVYDERVYLGGYTSFSGYKIPG